MAAGRDLESYGVPAGRKPRRSRWCSRRSSCCRWSSSSSSAFGLQRLPDAARLSRRAATSRASTAASTTCRTLHDVQRPMSPTAKFCFIVWALTARHRLPVAYFLRLPRTLGDDADGAVPRLPHPVLDVERHPHDFVDSAAGAQWPRNQALVGAHVVDAPVEWLLYSPFSSRSPSSTCSPSHGRAIFNFDDAH